MSQQFEEQLSAFMDGELGRDETRFLLRRAESDAALASAGRAITSRARHCAARRSSRLRADFSSAVLARSMPKRCRSPAAARGCAGAPAARSPRPSRSPR